MTEPTPASPSAGRLRTILATRPVDAPREACRSDKGRGTLSAMAGLHPFERRRIFVAWIVTVVVFAAVVLVNVLVEPGYGRVLGLPASSALNGIAYVAAAAMGAATFRWLRTTRQRRRPMTVRELRWRAGHRTRQRARQPAGRQPTHTGFRPVDSLPRSDDQQEESSNGYFRPVKHPPRSLLRVA